MSSFGEKGSSPACAVTQASLPSQRKEMKKLTTEDIIAKFVEVHGNKYDYSLIDYKGVDYKVDIICNEHGIFRQTPYNHIHGQECKFCSFIETSKRMLLDTNRFIESAVEIHGAQYDYSLTNYTGSKKKVLILCNKHGCFSQRACNHLLGRGCPKCKAEKQSITRRLDKEAFILNANKVHNFKYDYNNVEYSNNRSIVSIICPDHGLFRQKANNHLNGKGCPLCAQSGFSLFGNGFVYILQSADMIKVGITNKEVNIRVKQINRYSPQQFTAVFYKEMQASVANKVETKLLTWLRCQGLSQPIDKFNGYSECFYPGNITLPQTVDKLLEFESEVENGWVD